MKWFRSSMLGTVAGVTLLLAAVSARGDVPRLIHYQGKLVTNTGAIVAGPVSIRARLYDSPTGVSPVLFDETHSAVALNRGMFSILLGSQSGGGVPDAVLSGDTIFLGVSVDGAAELAPRVRIATAPYASKTKSAEQLVEPGTVAPAVSVAAGGRVGIGTQTPNASASLHVASTTGGFLPPSMNTAQRDAIASPAPGLQIFNTDTKCYNMWDGSTWRQSCFECAFSPPTASNDGPICEGETLNLTATLVAGATYSWTGPNGFSSTDQNPSISNATTSASGPYSVTATVNGCTSNPVTTLASVSAIPSAPSATSNSPVCLGQTLTFDAASVPGATYVWSGPNGFTSSLEDPSIPNVTMAAAGMYSLVVSVNGCLSSAATTNVSINQAPPVPGAISGSTSGVCNATGVFYSVGEVPGAMTYTWTVPTGASIVSGQGSTFLTVNFGSQDGDITVTAGNSCGTSAASTLAVTMGCPLYAFTSHTFTNCGQIGRLGPSLAQCRSAYSTAWDENSSFFSVTSGIQVWTVPQSGTYRIESSGAKGGNAQITGGYGAQMAGDFVLDQGDVLRIVVGQRGADLSESGCSRAGGGGGAAWVSEVVPSGGNLMFDGTRITPLIIAGGGSGSPYSGGSSYGGMLEDMKGRTSNSGANSNGSGGGSGGNGGAAGGGSDGGRAHGGGGLLTDGGCFDCGESSGNGTGGKSFLNGGNGGFGYPGSCSPGINGGFGGGGGGTYSGGGGGGYSGGSGGWATPYVAGGGGGSYNAGTNQTGTTGANNGHGSVVITRL